MVITKSLYVLWLIGIGLISQIEVSAQEIKWTSFENLSDSIRKQQKPLMVFLETDWCKFCAMQKKNTFTNTEVIEKLNSNFYALKLNGESRETIKFLNRAYGFKSSGAETGNHELAEFLGKEKGQLVYPTTVFLTKSLTIAGRKVGFTDASELVKYLDALSNRSN